jgi:signal transduction histidine kinase
MSAIEHLLEIEQNPVHRQVLDLADLSSHRLYTLVEEVLDFSKIEGHKLELDEETFNLRKCLQDSVNMMKVKASEKRLSLKLEISPDVPEYIFGDEFRLGQILLNLIGNAIKFTEDGGIEISLHLKEESLVFKVKDTGIGIAEERLESVFDAFSQADSSTTRKYGGTGLGLAISKGIIELMGGLINVQSQLGKGSLFTFSLPMKS